MFGFVGSCPQSAPLAPSGRSRGGLMGQGSRSRSWPFFVKLRLLPSVAWSQPQDMLPVDRPSFQVFRRPPRAKQNYFDLPGSLDFMIS